MDDSIFGQLPPAAPDTAGAVDGSDAVNELWSGDNEQLDPTIYKHGTNSLYGNDYATVCWIVRNKTSGSIAAYQTVSSGEKNTKYTIQQLLDTRTGTWSKPLMFPAIYPACPIPGFDTLNDKCVYQFNAELGRWYIVAEPDQFEKFKWPPHLPPIELLRMRQKRSATEVKGTDSERKCALSPAIDKFSLLRVQGQKGDQITELGKWCRAVGIDYTSEEESIVVTTSTMGRLFRLDMHTAEIKLTERIELAFGVAVANDGCVAVSRGAPSSDGRTQYSKTPVVHLIEPIDGISERKLMHGLEDVSKIMPGGARLVVARGMAFTKDSQHLIISDREHDKICVFNRDGRLLHSFGSTGRARGQFDTPEGVAVHPTTGEIYICNMENNAVDVYSPTYKFVRSIEPVPTPTCITLDNDGNFAVTSLDVPGIRIYTSSGEQMREIVYCGHWKKDTDESTFIPSSIDNDCSIAFDTRTGLLWVAEAMQVYTIK